MSNKRTATKNTKTRDAQEEFLSAVKSFASSATKEFREELDCLVARAQRTGSKLADKASKTFHTADGRPVEFSGETAREGLNAVRRAAGGFLEGLAQTITPRTTKPVTKKKTAAKNAVKKKVVKKKVVKNAKIATAKRRSN